MYKERAFLGLGQVDGDTPEVGYCAEAVAAVTVAYCAEVELVRRDTVDFSDSL